MAQNSAGIFVGYGETESALTLLPDVASIPDIGGEPETLETTTLKNKKYTSYIAGLQDLGGSLGFEANLTPELQKACKNIIGKTQTWYICFPAPLSCYYKWTGELQPLPVTGVGVNEVLKTTIYITVQDELNGPNEPGEHGVGGTYANSSDAEKITKAAG